MSNLLTSLTIIKGPTMAIHKLRALEYLTSVVEQGSFAAAARSLGVAPPSIHRLVGALERELGVPLLDRNATPVAPTPEARRYLERARALLSELGASKRVWATMRMRRWAP